MGQFENGVEGVHIMALKRAVTTQVGRDPKTGKFIPVKDTKRRKSTTVVDMRKKTCKIIVISLGLIALGFMFYSIGYTVGSFVVEYNNMTIN